jgi:peroxiredoxin
MNNSLHQPPMAARPPQGQRGKLAVVCLALVLVLPAAELGLASRTAIPDRRLASTEEEVARVARAYQGTSPAGTLQEILGHPDVIPSHHHSLLGQRAPDFELADVDGKAWNLGDLLAGGPAVLIFYYGYYCDHCVRQLFDVNRDLPLFRAVGARVAAISSDPSELTQRRFQQYGRFGFPVLFDPGNKVAHGYQVFRAGLLRHGTFLLDRDGMVRWVNMGDAPFRRNPALLCQLARMEGRMTSVQPGQ